jgi:hypothetical protein
VNSKEENFCLNFVQEFDLGGYVGFGLQELNHQLKNRVHRPIPYSYNMSSAYSSSICPMFLHVSLSFFIYLSISRKLPLTLYLSNRSHSLHMPNDLPLNLYLIVLCLYHILIISIIEYV